MTNFLANPQNAIKHSLHWLLLLLALPCFAQNKQIDSLKTALNKTKQDTSRIVLLKEIASAYTQVDLNQRLKYAKLAAQLAGKLHDQRSIADAYLSIGTAYGIQGKLDSGIMYFQKAYSTAAKINYEMVMGKSQTNMGFANDKLDNAKEAISCYFVALNIFKKIKYLPGINQCYTNIGSLYFDRGQPALAKTYFDECLKTYTADKDERGIAYALYNLGNCYQDLNKNELALTYLDKSLTIRKKLNDVNGVGLVQRAKGLAYLHLKEYDLAIANLDSALTAMVTLQDTYQQAAVMLALSQVYRATGDYVKAEYNALKGLKICREIKTKNGISLMLHELIKVYKQKKDINKAFAYQSEYVDIIDSLRNEKLVKDITVVEFKRVKQENTALADNNRTIKSENTGYLTKLQQYNNILVIIIATLAFVTLAVVVLYKRNKEKQIVNKQLIQQKEEIAHINKELELLNEEINAQMELTTSQNAELERLNSVKNKFFSIISHDLRGPLNTLHTLFKIYREGDIKEDELRALLGRLEDTILTTGAFLDNLLEWSKSQLEGIVVRAEDFDVKDTITDNLHLFQTKIEFKGLKVNNKVKHPVIVYADPNMIRLVIRNLLSNSVKFCSTGDKIEIASKIDGNDAVITIKDTGPGINEAEVEKLFSLEHAVSLTDQGEKGNRLGLILCRDMIAQNNGSLTLQTKLGIGTTFTITLPGSKQAQTLF
ncbi:tetratricopeptide repeat-containing sensor histidine kinase [Mucilaginibacter auburnensis]|uniref:histidine kinase n=1 Tax=Mucilaginibacter auburnensis TaxID=1457233 RepID=A0A2H9VV31_9SPHI|nr:tetratricopeptide repeat-containing sensor histidine kinase [Mucilaginibacter auburnensis]PJJ84684.1 signal transduction histidine kinase [Mucilaginibacter auburnensis]